MFIISCSIVSMLMESSAIAALSFLILVICVFPVYLILSLSSVQSLSHVRLFGTPWTAACQASLSITNSQSLLKLMSIESVMPSNHLILCHLFLLLPSIFPSLRVFFNEFFASGGQSIAVSASASVLPMNIQNWFPLGFLFLSKYFRASQLYLCY